MLFNWDQHFHLSHYLESFPLDFFFIILIILGVGDLPPAIDKYLIDSPKTTVMITTEAHWLQTPSKTKTTQKQHFPCLPSAPTTILVPADLGV